MCFKALFGKWKLHEFIIWYINWAIKDFWIRKDICFWILQLFRFCPLFVLRLKLEVIWVMAIQHFCSNRTNVSQWFICLQKLFFLTEVASFCLFDKDFFKLEYVNILNIVIFTQKQLLEFGKIKPPFHIQSLIRLIIFNVTLLQFEHLKIFPFCFCKQTQLFCWNCALVFIKIILQA